jgi:sulfide:quinone oxidoreductase
MRVVIAGGGVAALEALAGLRALAGDRVETTLLSPVDTFSYRPLSTAVPFTFREERTRSLAELAGDLDARFVRDGLAQVDASRTRVLTRDGDFLPYDALLIAVGARVSRRPGEDVAWSRGSQGVAALTALLLELEAGSVRSVAFVAPPAAAWPMDAYELAFVARLAAERAGGDTRVVLVTAEQAPVEALGAAASEAVADELARADIDFVTGVEVAGAQQGEEAGSDMLSSVMPRLSRGGRGPDERLSVLHLDSGSNLAVDRAVRLPVVHGPAVPGVARDDNGFLMVDGHARSTQDPRVFAAGDATALALKHSTLASAQATAAAEALAAEAGADLEPAPWSSCLYGLLTLPPHFPGARGSAWLPDGGPITHCLWWPPGHVAGRHLAPCLAARDTGVRPGLERHPNGLPVAVPVGREPVATGDGPARASSDAALRHDALTRQLLAIRRAEREGRQLGLDLKSRLVEVESHEQEVVGRLEAAGYLSHEG